MYNNSLIAFNIMENNEFDKYMKYVIAQVGEGNHSKDEMKEDLLSRGLSNEDADKIIKCAYALGMKAENEKRIKMSLSLIINLAPPIAMCILLWIAGASIIHSCSFGMVIGGIIAFVRIQMQKKKFK